jgi:hypothetical protein
MHLTRAFRGRRAAALLLDDMCQLVGHQSSATRCREAGGIPAECDVLAHGVGGRTEVACGSADGVAVMHTNPAEVVSEPAFHLASGSVVQPAPRSTEGFAHSFGEPRPWSPSKSARRLRLPDHEAHTSWNHCTNWPPVTSSSVGRLSWVRPSASTNVLP